MTKLIPLTGKNGIGKFVIVDDHWYDRLIQWKWHLKKGYAVRSLHGDMIFMHRIINKTPMGMHTDHIDGNKLDNRETNLRAATNSQNQMNRGKQKNNKSGYKGVSWDSQKNKYRVQIKVNGKKINLGYFEENKILEAAIAYDKAVLKYHGNVYSKLNFPNR